MGAAELRTATLPRSAAMQPCMAAKSVVSARVLGRAQTSVLDLWDPLERRGEVSALTSA